MSADIKSLINSGYSSIIEEVYSAFADAKKPSDDNLFVTARCYDEAPCFIESPWVHWQDIPIDVVLNNNDIIGAFTAEAYIYYLPAYLIVSMCYPSRAISEYIKHSIEPIAQSSTYESDLTDCQSKQYKLLLSKHKQAIKLAYHKLEE